MDPASASVATASSGTSLSNYPPLEDISLSTFTYPAVIDNRWFPLEPGKQTAFTGITEEDGETIPHHVTFTVTDLTKVIAGVRAPRRLGT